MYSHVFRTSTPAPPKKDGAKNCRVATGAELVTTQECLERARDKVKAGQPKKKAPKTGKKVNSYSYNVASS